MGGSRGTHDSAGLDSRPGTYLDVLQVKEGVDGPGGADFGGESDGWNGSRGEPVAKAIADARCDVSRGIEGKVGAGDLISASGIGGG